MSTWKDTEITFYLKTEYPIIQAGMAGVSTKEMVVAVSEAGGLGTIAGGYLTTLELEAEIHYVKQHTNKPFSVNLFVLSPTMVFSEQLNQVEKYLAPIKKELGIERVDNLVYRDQSLDEKIELIIALKVPVVSFTFGIPSEDMIDRLRDEGIIVIGTATSVKEGLLWETAGCHMLVAQGFEAGGHRASFLVEEHHEYPMIGTFSLLPQITETVVIPIIAAGGIMDARGVVAAMALGARGVQMGTAFITTKESAASKSYQQAVYASSDDSTIITSVFSGKPARTIRNRFTEELANVEHNLPPFPVQHALTKEIRQVASQKEDTQWMSLFAGQNAGIGKMTNAKRLIEKIVDDIEHFSWHYEFVPRRDDEDEDF